MVVAEHSLLGPINGTIYPPKTVNESDWFQALYKRNGRL